VTAGPFPKVTVCLLNYRGAPYLADCLEALRALDPAPVEIVAVDNASPDGSGALLDGFARDGRSPPVRYIAAGGNLGYAAGHNRGARAASGEYLAFLNATVRPESGWLEVVRWMAAHPDVAFAQPAVFHRDDRERLESLGTILTPSGNLWVLGRNRRETGIRPGEPPYVSEVLSVLGAAFVARRTAFEALGGFDESMFMYFEETDLCWRGWLTGMRSVCWFDGSRPTRVFHRVHGSHPAGFDVARYFERNRTLTLYRNLERRNLWHLGPNLLTVTAEMIRRPRALARYAAEVLERLPEANRRRGEIQSGRSVPDDRLFGLRPPTDLDRRFKD
jgi:GT2 family glycosyltransferase